MRVMGIDPGAGTTGYAVVERSAGRPRALAVGVVTTPSTEVHARRLAMLQARLGELMRAHEPAAAAVETLFFNLNVRTAMSVGQAAGVALAAAAECGLDVAHYTPTEVKLAVAGVGTAPKAQVQAMVARLLGLPRAPAPADAADACALALCHLSRAGLAAALGGAAR
jgi:crossover junction endodeoxyribonuclease RuvC